MRAVGIGDTLGRYELLEELGEGGMATVYLARDTALKREVAVKVLFAHLAKRREITARFQREGRAAAALDHPHILRVFDVGGGEVEHEGDDIDVREVDPPYIVLELVRGPSLDSTVGEPPLAEVVAAIGVAVCEALMVAHQAGIVHRDVKPANVLVADGGRLVLGDFGVARVSEGDSLVTRTGAVLGTPAFMAPEQAAGDEADARTDLYSLGVMLYQIGTGSLPFKGNAAAVVSQILIAKWTPPERRNPALGRDLCRVIERLMSLRPEDRYVSAEEARAALEAVCELGGFDDVDGLLREHFDGDDSLRRAHREKAVQSTLTAARSAADSGSLPRALALADRVLALDKENTEALELVDSLGSRKRRKRLYVGLGIFSVAAAVAASGGYAMWNASESGSTFADAGSAAAPIADAGEDAAPLVDATEAVDAAPPDAPLRGTTTSAVSDRPREPLVAERRADAAPEPTEPVDETPPVIDPPEVEEKATVVARSHHYLCDFYVDGTLIEKNVSKQRPKRIEVTAGMHIFTCKNDKFAPWSKRIQVSGGDSVNVTPRFLPLKIRVKVVLPTGDKFEVDSYGDQLNRSTFELRNPPRRLLVKYFRRGKLVRQNRIDFETSCTLKLRGSGIVCD